MKVSTPNDLSFDPFIITHCIRSSLRMYYSKYGSDDLVWSEDRSLTKIFIDSINDVIREDFGGRPRIIVDRGPCSANHVGLNDNLASAPNQGESRGLDVRQSMVLMNGTASIGITSSTEGVCEKLSKEVFRFILTAGPLIADTWGFKLFGHQLQMSNVYISKEDDYVFKCNISFPYAMESRWSSSDDAPILKDIVTCIKI